MNKFLIVIGCQKEKLDQIDKKIRRNMLDYINSHGHDYDGVISIIRKQMNGDDNFQKMKDNVATDDRSYLDYESTNVIEVPGYDVDCSLFRRDATYDIMGISTSASVLCIAMSMFSCGLRIRVLKELCEDRKSKKLEEYAFSIMEAYMPGCLV